MPQSVPNLSSNFNKHGPRENRKSFPLENETTSSPEGLTRREDNARLVQDPRVLGRKKFHRSPADRRREGNGQTHEGSRYSHLEGCRHASAARCASHFIHPPPVFGTGAAVAGAGARRVPPGTYIINRQIMSGCVAPRYQRAFDSPRQCPGERVEEPAEETSLSRFPLLRFCISSSSSSFLLSSLSFFRPLSSVVFLVFSTSFGGEIDCSSSSLQRRPRVCSFPRRSHFRTDRSPTSPLPLDVFFLFAFLSALIGFPGIDLRDALPSADIP